MNVAVTRTYPDALMMLYFLSSSTLVVGIRVHPSNVNNVLTEKIVLARSLLLLSVRVQGESAFTW